MNADGFATFWAFIIALAMTAFSVLAVVVTVRSLQDVRAMFARINEQHRANSSSHDETA